MEAQSELAAGSEVSAHAQEMTAEKPGTEQADLIPEFAEAASATPEERAYHEAFMREALKMADLALNTDETPVGCVFVHNGTIVGRGMNDTNRSMNGTRHAEFMALRDMLSPPSPSPLPSTPASSTTSSIAAPTTTQHPPSPPFDPAHLSQTTLYVTVEPCIMCASLLRQYGIKKVYFGARNDKFGGTGGVLRIHEVDEGLGYGVTQVGDKMVGRDRLEGYEVSGGWLGEEAVELLRKYYERGNLKAPKPHRRKEKVKVDDDGDGVEGDGRVEMTEKEQVVAIEPLVDAGTRDKAG